MERETPTTVIERMILPTNMFRTPSPTKIITMEVQSSLSLCYDNKYSEDITLNIDNIGPLLTSLGVKQGETGILDLIRNALIDTNGCIDPLELERAIVNVSLENGDDEEAFFEEAFTIIDLDNDGYITAPDIYRLFQKLNIGTTDEGLITLLKNLDFDRDGSIDYEDFRSFMLGLEFQEPEIKSEHNCSGDDDDVKDDDEASSRLNIAALRDRRPSLRKLTKEDSQFNLVSEKKRSLFSYAGVVKDTFAVVSYIRRVTQTDKLEQDVQQIQEKLEATSSQLTATQGESSRRSSLRSDISNISRLLPPSTNRRRNSVSSSASSVGSFSPEDFLHVLPANFSRRPSMDSACSSQRSRNNSEKLNGNVSIRINGTATGAMNQVIPKTVVGKAKDTGQDKSQSGVDDNELLCLKDLCLTITDTDSGNDSALTLSQTVNGLVEQASGMANRRNSTADLDSSIGRSNWGTGAASSAKSPGQQKRQLSVESSANEFRDDNSSVKCPRDNYDPDDMTSATRNNLFEFHKITSKSSNSIGAESTLPEEIPQGPQNLNAETPRSKRSDMKPFFPAGTPNTRLASPGCSRTGKENGDSETDDMYISLVEKYHRPQRRYRRRISNDSATVGKCLKVRTLKKTKSVAKAKKEEIQSPDVGTKEIRVPTAGYDVDDEEKRLREERLQNFVNAESNDLDMSK
ncbi:hypothetical protein LOTGIDRAFT_175106 [Lottia gigantea]|uniref:EF-hand domain-containing protein n=1 Tax=Lottia gigantea TaxID=225164 RepID=V4ALJ2_LOTGI|nr:hypothetical protein LOTGIDRAFT_175106 [Lottia gigantea]ESO95630.1 hypothetical protein LOTGIDRAFT_175106 [Lottia gigantea]